MLSGWNDPPTSTATAKFSQPCAVEVDPSGVQRAVEAGAGHEGGDLRQERRVPGLRRGQRDDELVEGPGAAVVGDVAVGRDRGLHLVVAEADTDARDVLELGAGTSPDLSWLLEEPTIVAVACAAVDDVDAVGPAVDGSDADLRAGALGDQLVQRARGVVAEGVEPAVVGGGDQQPGVLAAEGSRRGPCRREGLALAALLGGEAPRRR